VTNRVRCSHSARPQTENSNDQEGQVRENVEAVGDAEEGSRIGEGVVAEILLDRIQGPHGKGRTDDDRQQYTRFPRGAPRLNHQGLSVAGVLIELHVPVGAGAKVLVRAGPTSTQGDVIEGCALGQLYVFQFYATATDVRTIRGHTDLRITTPFGVFHTIDAITERARRTLLDRLDDLVRAGSVGIDEGLLARSEHGFQRTPTSVSTKPAIVVHDDLVTFEGFPFVGYAIRYLCHL